MSDVLRLTAADLGEKIAARELTAVEVAQAFLDQIARNDDAVHAFLHVDAEGALAQAAAVDARLDAGEKLGPLAGVPLALKDLFTQEGVPTTAGSRILEGWRPAVRCDGDATPAGGGHRDPGQDQPRRVRDGVLHRELRVRAHPQPVGSGPHPRRLGRGLLGALAAFEAPLAIGTDTGGSIRQPASVTGTVGVKPTYGGTSRYGVIAMASSLDQPGPCARTVLDAALLHEVIAGHDPLDSTSIDAPVPPVVEAARSGDVSGMRIGVVKELGGEGYAPGVEQRFTEALAAAARGRRRDRRGVLPALHLRLGAYYLIMPSEVSSNLARYDGMRYGLRVGDDGTRGTEEVMAAHPRRASAPR
jgi:aspartyl-tRNA(Asn)/glutamyl-tRNA(Gln) amidotransferase subunit A